MTILEALKRLRDDLKLWVSNNIRAINENIEHVKAELDKKPTMGDDEISGSLTIDADTLNGYTAAQIIAQANSGSGGTPIGGGNVSYEKIGTENIVKLTSTTEVGQLFPQTNIAAVNGLQDKINEIEGKINSGSSGGSDVVLPSTVMSYYRGSVAPSGTSEEKFGIIWFDTSHADNTSTGRCFIKIWNGAFWEVMNSWQ